MVETDPQAGCRGQNKQEWEGKNPLHAGLPFDHGAFDCLHAIWPLFVCFFVCVLAMKLLARLPYMCVCILAMVHLLVCMQFGHYVFACLCVIWPL